MFDWVLMCEWCGTALFGMAMLLLAGSVLAGMRSRGY